MSEPLHWLIRSLPEIPDNNEWLSDGERAVLAKLRFFKKRNDWCLGRWTAKQAICAYQSKRDPVLSSLEIRAAPDGAPEAYWADGSSPISISISHSNNRSLCVIGPCEFAVGCDLEWIEPRENVLIQDYFLAEEIAYTMQVPAAVRDLTVNLIWSAKETVLKVLREGLRRDPRGIFIQLDSHDAEREWSPWRGSCAESLRDFSGWWRYGEGYVYTMAADQPTSAPKQIPEK